MQMELTGKKKKLCKANLFITYNVTRKLHICTKVHNSVIIIRAKSFHESRNVVNQEHTRDNLMIGKKFLITDALYNF